MVSITNPSSVDIIDRNVDGRLWSVKAGDTVEVPNMIGEVLLETYGFLSGTEATPDPEPAGPVNTPAEKKDDSAVLAEDVEDDTEVAPAAPVVEEEVVDGSEVEAPEAEVKGRRKRN